MVRATLILIWQSYVEYCLTNNLVTAFTVNKTDEYAQENLSKY